MKRFMRISLAAWALVLSASPSSAESVDLLASEYKPLTTTKAGRVEMCGVHFSAVVRTLDKRILNIQGSVNSAYFAGKVPGFMIKVSTSEVLNNNLDITPRKVQFASFRVGQTDTLAMQAHPGSDGNSMLLTTNLEQTGEFFFSFPELFYQGAWVSVSLDRNNTDYTFRLPAFGADDADTMQQAAECNLVGIAALKREIEAMPAAKP
jgi:hypothetical protein